MIQKKICMLGSFAVGKTSLVARFVNSIFSDKYQTTIGVKIDKKLVTVGEQDVTLILWDLHGEDEFQRIRTSYLRGASGYFLVVDGARRATLDAALILQKSTGETIGQVPFILVLNKSDLADDWEIDEDTMGSLSAKGWTITKTSAKTGSGVEAAFMILARDMLKDRDEG